MLWPFKLIDLHKLSAGFLVWCCSIPQWIQKIWDGSSQLLVSVPKTLMGTVWEAASPSLLLTGKTLWVFDLHIYQGTSYTEPFWKKLVWEHEHAACWTTHPYLPEWEIRMTPRWFPDWFLCCVQAESLLLGTHSAGTWALPYLSAFKRFCQLK